MAIQVLNNQESAQVFRGKLNDNYNELQASKATVNHASSENIYGVASNSMYGHVKVTTGNGLNNNSGTLSMGAATTSTPGTVQLVDNATTNDSTKAATAAALKGVKDSAVATYYGTTAPDAALGKNGDIYIKVS